MNANKQAQTQTTYSVAPMVSGGKFQLLLLAHCQNCGKNFHAALSHVCQPARPQQRCQIEGKAQSADRRNVTAYPRQALRPSQHVGAVSQRIQIKARIRCCIHRETRYGDAWWTLLIDGNHNLYVYFGSVRLGEPRQIITLTATVKAHTVWKDTKQTQISHPKPANPTTKPRAHSKAS